MALTHVPVTPPTAKQTVTNASNEIREKIAQIVSLADIRLTEIRNIVREHTRATIAAELGSDAAAMLSVYNDLKSAIETAKDTAIDALP